MNGSFSSRCWTDWVWEEGSVGGGGGWVWVSGSIQGRAKYPCIRVTTLFHQVIDEALTWWIMFCYGHFLPILPEISHTFKYSLTHTDSCCMSRALGQETVKNTKFSFLSFGSSLLMYISLLLCAVHDGGHAFKCTQLTVLHCGRTERLHFGIQKMLHRYLHYWIIITFWP